MSQFFSLSFFTLIKRLSSFSLLSAIRVISSSYLRLLIFLLAILIPACDSSSPAFHMMFFAEKLNKQGDDIQLSQFWKNNSFPNFEPVHCSLSGFNCWFFSCTQILQELGLLVWYSHLFKNFPQFVVIHTVKGFTIVNEPESETEICSVAPDLW